MSKIKVPEGMLAAVLEAVRIEWAYDEEVDMSSHRYMYTVVLQAALQWLSENPILPRLEDIESMSYIVFQGSIARRNRQIARIVVDNCAEWQRRMFLAPEPPEQHGNTSQVANDKGWTTSSWSKNSGDPAPDGMARKYFKEGHAEQDILDLILTYPSPSHKLIVEAYRIGMKARQ